MKLFLFLGKSGVLFDKKRLKGDKNHLRCFVMLVGISFIESVSLS